ncbi:MAG: hypothetical protein Q8R13_04770 [bacterium]|nr:hypothetical protein [bacterium]MDZ4296005.1 hypothetical protein [Patescibacteria group bacterium]
MSTKSLEAVVPATDEELCEMHGGIIGLMKHFPVEGDKLGIDLRQAGIFCRNTPGGKKGLELWQEYVSRRDAPTAPVNYHFGRFICEVLADAGYPIK